MPFQAFRIKTKLVGWKNKELYFEQRLITTDAKGKEFVNAFSVSIYKIPRKSEVNAVDIIRMVDEEYAIRGDEYLPHSKESKSSGTKEEDASVAANFLDVGDVILAYNAFEEKASSILNPKKLR